MNRSDVKELCYITHIDNLKSILEFGILCYNKTEKVKFKSIANGKIQSRRDKVVIPGGKHKLHDYANLYFNARNPMMFKRKDMHKELAVLRIAPAIFDEPEVVISDGNASSDYVRFYPSPQGLENLEKSLVYTDDWRDKDTFQYWRRKSAICAEVLVPDLVESRFVIGVYVSCRDSYQKLIKSLQGFPIVDKISIDPKIFFQEV